MPRPPRASSLKTRLAWGMGVSLVVLLTLLAVGVKLAFEDILNTQMSTRLGHDAESVLNALSIDDMGPLVDPGRMDPIFSRPFSGHYFMVLAGDRRLRSRSLWDQGLEIDFDAASQSPQVVQGPQGQTLLVIAHSYKKSGRTVQIAVAEDLTHLQRAVQKAQWRYGIAMLIGLVMLVAVQRWLVGTTLRPLDGVLEDVAALERGEVASLRETVPVEVRPLVTEINRLLTLMTHRVARSRNALGNLAHALKTPLTLLTQMADAPEIAANPALKERLVRETDSIGKLMERELKRARLAGAAAPGQRLDLNEELTGLAAALAAVYREKNLKVVVDLPPDTVFSGDREDVLELFGNLMDNACKWAASTVRVRREMAPGLVLTVEDDGPGAAPEVMDSLTERGTRADETAPGHGLGLAIAREVVESYGGHLELGRSEALGGFMATVRLPNRRARPASDN